MPVVTLSAGSGGFLAEYFRRDQERTEQEQRMYRYLLDEAAHPRFMGRGAEALGLLGQPSTPELFAKLAQGIGPNGERLRQNAGDSSDAAQDLTISFEKSVSIAAVTAGAADRKGLLRVVEDTQHTLVRFVEEHVAQTRRGSGGRNIEGVGGLVMLPFWHVESRYGDPQLHVHVVIFNSCMRRDGTWGALHTPSLYRSKMALGALATADLASGLRVAGVALRKSQNGFELRAIPDELCREMSSGRAAVVRTAKQLGYESAKALAEIHKRIRPAKRGYDRRARLKAWRDKAAEFGVTPESLRNMCRAKQVVDLDRCRTSARRAVRWAVEQLASHTSTYGRTDVLRLAARACSSGRARLEDLERATDHVLREDPGIYRLGVHAGEERFAGRKGVEIEQEALQRASNSRAEERHIIGRRILRKVAEAAQLDTEQAQALRDIAGTVGGIKLLTGGAGTGKTRVLAAVAEAARQDGRRVVGLAPTGVAREGLARGAGIAESFTVAKFVKMVAPTVSQQLAHHARMLGRAAVNKPTWTFPRARLQKGDLLIVDEAAMVGFRDLALLIEKCQAAGAKLVLCGDTKQLGPIRAGASLFGELEGRLGAAVLHKNWRQSRKPWMEELSGRLAAAEPDEALRLLAEKQRLHVATGLDSPIKQCLDRYMRQSPTERRESIVLATTRAQVGDINHRIQQARHERREVGASFATTPASGRLDRNGELIEQGPNRFFVGDRVVLRRNREGCRLRTSLWALGDRREVKGRIVNGDFGDVVSARGHTMLVRLDRTANDGAPLFAKIDLKEYPDVDLGYAATVHRAQGRTVDRAFVVLDPGHLDRELGYVALTRQSNDLHVFTHEIVAGEELAEVSRALRRSRREELATTLKAQIEASQTYAAEDRVARPEVTL